MSLQALKRSEWMRSLAALSWASESRHRPVSLWLQFLIHLSLPWLMSLLWKPSWEKPRIWKVLVCLQQISQRMGWVPGVIGRLQSGRGPSIGGVLSEKTRWSLPSLHWPDTASCRTFTLNRFTLKGRGWVKWFSASLIYCHLLTFPLYINCHWMLSPSLFILHFYFHIFVTYS